MPITSTHENKELVLAELLSLAAIEQMPDYALKALAKACMAAYPDVETVSKAVMHFVATCDRLPKPVEFLRWLREEMKSVSVPRLQCTVCHGNGFVEITCPADTLDGVRSVPFVKPCKCRPTPPQD